MRAVGRRTRSVRAGRTTLLGLCAAVVLLTTAGPVPASSAGPEGAPDPCALTEVLENPCRPLLGAESNWYVPEATFPVRVAEHETRIGRSVEMVHIYVNDRPTMTSLEKSVASRPDKIALVNWKVSSRWADTATGKLDAAIDVMADDLASIPHRVMLTLGHEPELHLSPGGAVACPTAASTDSRGTPADYVAMWHRVRERFEAKGVDNVVWVMNYLGYAKYNGCTKSLWPGNDHVDWVMWDPYPFDASWTATVGGFYDYLSTHSDAEHDFLGKPWGLAEWGYLGTSQQAALEMYAEARATLHTGVFPKLKAYLIWDNLVVGGQDVRVGHDSAGRPDPAEQAAYNAFANDPTFRPDHTAPSQVGGLSVDQLTDSSARLSWTPAQDEVRVAGYRVRRDGLLRATLPANAAGHTDTGLADGRTHSYVVSAFDPSGNESAPSQALQVTTPDTTAPSAPGNLRGAASGRAVRLTWTRPTDNVGVTSYVVQRGSTRLGSTTGTSFTDTAPPQGRRHTYRVRALDSAQNSSGWSSATTVAVADRTAPGRVPRLVAAGGRRKATMAWTKAPDNVGVTRYWLYRSTTRVRVLSAAARRFTVKGLKARRTYTFRLVAVDAAGNRSPSRSVRVRTR